MELPSTKELARIVKICRKQGIKTFECGELRITLSDSALAIPAQRAARKSLLAGPKDSIQHNTIPDSLPSEQELLFASVGGPPPELFE